MICFFNSDYNSIVNNSGKYGAFSHLQINKDKVYLIWKNQYSYGILFSDLI